MVWCMPLMDCMPVDCWCSNNPKTGSDRSEEMLRGRRRRTGSSRGWRGCWRLNCLDNSQPGCPLSRWGWAVGPGQAESLSDWLDWSDGCRRYNYPALQRLQTAAHRPGSSSSSYWWSGWLWWSYLNLDQLYILYSRDPLILNTDPYQPNIYTNIFMALNLQIITSDYLLWLICKWWTL